VKLGEGFTTGAAEFVGVALGTVIVDGDVLDEEGRGEADVLVAWGGVDAESTGIIGFWVTSTCGGRAMFVPESFTL
jgi:hypothetical protein